jgi:hypothetical protein
MTVDFRDDSMNGVWLRTLCKGALRESCSIPNKDPLMGPHNQYCFEVFCSADPCASDYCGKYLGGNPHDKR